MRTIAAIFIASIAVTAPAILDTAAAASAEGAIKAWIAAVPGPDWKVAYGSIAYDMASDKTTVTGLAITSASLKVTVGFNTIVITGYTATPDGGFSAASLTADTGQFGSGKDRVTISGIAATDFGTAPLAPLAFDPKHPFTSIVALYSDMTKIHVGHAGVASVALKGDPDTQFSYTNFSVDGWANGKIASMKTGPLDTSFTDDNGDPGSVHIGGFESAGIDLDAIVRVFDPSRYVNGAGDGVWHTAVASATYHDFDVEGSSFNMTLGSWNLENVKMRQPAKSFTAALDAAATAGDHDPTPAETHALFDMLSSYALGKFSITDVSVDADGGSGSLGAFTLADLSSDGLGEISVDNLNFDFFDSFGKFGRLAAGGIVFPGIDKLMAAFDATQTGDDVDYGALAPKLGYVEAKDLDLQTPDTPEMTLDAARLDLTNYVGAIPTNIALSITGFDAPVGLFGEDGTGDMLLDLGYDRVHADYGAKLAWHEADGTVSLDDFHIALADIGNATASAVFSGLPRSALTTIDNLPDALDKMNLVSGTVTVEDHSLLTRWIAQQAYLMGIDQADFRKQLAAMAPDQVAGIGDDKFNAKLVTALQTFITRPGSVTVTAKPPMPIDRDSVMGVATILPALLPELLGLDISAVAGPVPTPYDYVPSNPPSPPGPPDDGLRHVPLKKY